MESQEELYNKVFQKLLEATNDFSKLSSESKGALVRQFLFTMGSADMFHYLQSSGLIY